MTALFLSPLYALLNVYLCGWLLKWLGAWSPRLKKPVVRGIVIALYSFFALSMVIAFLLPAGQAQRVMKLISNYWLGVVMYTFLTILLADILRRILRHIKKINQEKLRSRGSFLLGGSLCAAIILSLCIGGIVNAGIIRTTPYEITVGKDGGKLSSLKVVLLADLHLGYNIGCSRMEQMVEKVNSQNPDLVVIAGDIFDNEYEALDNPERLAAILSGMNSTYGTYACYGNHDIQEAILAGFTFDNTREKKESAREMDELLEKAGIRLLRDEAVLIDDSFYLYGRPDYSKPGRGVTARKTPEELVEGLDKEKPLLLIDHQPRELAELDQVGVDVDLCGHTHDGQVFPGNIIMDFLWENPCGYLLKGDMHNIVTSGVGLFGPNMRVGTIAEICPVTIHFTA